jgi:hypothetical protein
VFADVIAWLRNEHPDSLGRLQRNLRQLRNKAEGQGTAIVALSELFIIDDEDKALGGVDASTRPDQEELISRIHAGGEVDRDLDVIYWDAPEKLAGTLIEVLESRMKSGTTVESEEPFRLWRAALQNNPTAFQILTPHRGEMHGVEALNEACQQRIASNIIKKGGAVDGITLFDKVIQTRNRPKSNMRSAQWAPWASTPESGRH